MRKPCAQPRESTVMSNTLILSPRERLAASRQAIVRQMGHESSTAGEYTPSNEPGADDINASASTWDLARQVVAAWWRGHPAHLAIDLAKPVLTSYAEEKPLKLLGISAGLGAAVVLLRPWRLMSLTGLLLAALKSSQLSDAVSALLSRDHKIKHP